MAEESTEQSKSGLLCSNGWIIFLCTCAPNTSSSCHQGSKANDSVSFSALGRTCKNQNYAMWFVDSRASDHMTFSSEHLKNHTTEIYKFTLLMENVCLLRLLMIFLMLYVWIMPFIQLRWLLIFFQLDNLPNLNCNVSFSHFGCIVQVRIRGKWLGKDQNAETFSS